MSATSTLLTQYVLPVAVLVSATATTATATFAWRLYNAVNVHDRALFGSDEVERHDGIVSAVNENTERSERNRMILRANDLAPPGEPTYRTDSDHGDERPT